MKKCVSMPIKSRLAITAAALAITLASSSAMAQLDNATRAADPSRAQKNILDQQIKPQLSPVYEVKSAAMQKAPAGAENIKFVLQNLMIEGATAYPQTDIQALYADQIGKEITLADVYTIANTITNKYRNEGYILTQVVVPPQEIEGGNVKLGIVEGFVEKIAIEGETKESEAEQIRRYAENVTMKGVLNSKDLERNLLLINDLPGVTARTILSPSKTTVGASDMTIIVERDREEASLGFDNYGSRYLGAYQGTAIGTLNSYFGQNERINGQFVLSGDQDRLDELAFGSASYEQPITRDGTTIRAQASYARTRPGYDLKEFDVRGRSEYFILGVSHPCIRTRDQSLYVRGSFDARNVSSKNNVESTRKDKIRSVRAGINYQVIDTVVGVGANAVDFEISQGIGLLGASDKGDDNLSRERGDPQYTKANVQAQRLQRLSNKTNLLIAAEAQISADPLLSSEEFGVGGFGMGIGRGYDPSEIVGDDGIAGKIELQFNQPVPIPELHDYQLFTFFDTGRVWNQDATSSSDKRNSLSSFGVGIRADITEQTKAGFAVAKPLTREIDTRNDRDIRLLFNLNHEF